MSVTRCTMEVTNTRFVVGLLICMVLEGDVYTMMHSTLVPKYKLGTSEHGSRCLEIWL